MGNAYLYRMPSGIPGDVSRPSQATIEPGIFDSSFPFASYGIPAKKVNGKIRPVASGDAATVIIGLLVRPFPTRSSQDPLGTSTPPTTGVGDLMRRGYMTVQCNAGTPADGGTVYVRVAAASGAKVIGGIEAAADGTNTVVMAGAVFRSAGDASGNVEIEYNL
ncbi:Putative bacteriophage protein [Ralstonia mannitolilytica]|uniref:structural cement protein Gp24 n=1 Tax=Ralstonia mannitolilytica TaxID=105219 RepID=UPI0039B6836E